MAGGGSRLAPGPAARRACPGCGRGRRGAGGAGRLPGPQLRRALPPARPRPGRPDRPPRRRRPARHPGRAAAPRLRARPRLPAPPVPPGPAPPPPEAGRRARRGPLRAHQLGRGAGTCSPPGSPAIRETHGSGALFVPYGTGTYNQVNGSATARRLLNLSGGCLGHWNSYSLGAPSTSPRPPSTAPSSPATSARTGSTPSSS